MNILNSMLGATSWPGLIAELKDKGVEWVGNWVGDLLTVLSQVLWVLLALVGAAGAIYAVYVGVKMARADSAEAREENKKRLINIIVSIVVVIVLIVVFEVGVPAIVSAVVGDPSENGGVGNESIQTITNTIKFIVK